MPDLLNQLKRCDFTVSPFRTFADFDGDPEEFCLPPGGQPAMIGCPLDRGANSLWRWLSFFNPDLPPSITGETFARAHLEDEVARLLRVYDATQAWTADREIWVRHGVSIAELLDSEAA
jgi:hypothetical protein